MAGLTRGCHASAQTTRKLHAQAKAIKKPRKKLVRRATSASYRADPDWSPPPREPARRSGRQAGRPAVRYNLDSIEGDQWAEVRRPSKRAPREFVSQTEVYYQRHKDALGSTEKEWVLFRDGYDKNGVRIYDPENGKTCHQCRQKTMGKRTWCSHCNALHGVFCGDCLMMRYGEHVDEANANPDWKCPACRDLCNCSFCRTRKGYPPTGSMYRRAIREGYASVAHYLVDIHFREGPEPVEGKEPEAAQEQGAAPSDSGAQRSGAVSPPIPGKSRADGPQCVSPRARPCASAAPPPAPPQKRARLRPSLSVVQGGDLPAKSLLTFLGGDAARYQKEGKSVAAWEKEVRKEKDRVPAKSRRPPVPPPRGRRPEGKKWDGEAGAWVKSDETAASVPEPRSLQEARKFVGRRVLKHFPGHGNFEGKVSRCFHRKNAPCERTSKVRSGYFFRVVYSDGDEEDLLWDALIALQEPVATAGVGTARRQSRRAAQEPAPPPAKRAKKVAEPSSQPRSPKVTQIYRVTRSRLSAVTGRGGWQSGTGKRENI